MERFIDNSEHKEEIERLQKEIEEHEEFFKSRHGKYLGETPTDICRSPFHAHKKEDWAMSFIEAYGQIDGDHHKAWVLDQVARILNGTKVIVTTARWEDGHKEYRINVGKPSKKYLGWVKSMQFGEDGDETYGYEEGIAP